MAYQIIFEKNELIDIYISSDLTGKYDIILYLSNENNSYLKEAVDWKKYDLAKNSNKHFTKVLVIYTYSLKTIMLDTCKHIIFNVHSSAY